MRIRARILCFALLIPALAILIHPASTHQPRSMSRLPLYEIHDATPSAALAALSKQADITIDFRPHAANSIATTGPTVDLTLRDITVAQALSLILGQSGLTYEWTEPTPGHFLIGDADDLTILRWYDVHDLLAADWGVGDPRDEILRVMRDVADAYNPATGFRLGSFPPDAQAEFAGDTLVIKGPPSTQTRVQQILKEIRQGLSSPTAMTWDPLESTCRHASLSIL